MNAVFVSKSQFNPLFLSNLPTKSFSLLVVANKDLQEHLFFLFAKNNRAMKIYLTSFFLLLFSMNGFSQSTLSGKVTDADTGEPILFGDVVIYRNGKLVIGEQTDFDGNYIISPIDAGTYDVVFKYVGYRDVEMNNVSVGIGGRTSLNASMIHGVALDKVIIYRCMMYRPLTEEDIADLPTKNIIDIVSQPSGCGYYKPKQLSVKSLHDESPEGYIESLVVKMPKEVENKLEDKIPDNHFNVIVFPNPVSDILQISLLKSDMAVKLFNLSGQLVLTLIKGDNRLDVSELPAGNYFLEIADGKTVQTERIVIIRD